MKFKDIAITGLFTFADKEAHGTGVYRKVSARKFTGTINEAYQDRDAMVITSINIDVEPWSAEQSARVPSIKLTTADGSIVTETSDPDIIKAVTETPGAVSISSCLLPSDHPLAAVHNGAIVSATAKAEQEAKDASHPDRAYMKPSPEQIIAESGIPAEKFDPMKLIEQLKARSWRNYTVIEYRGENEDPIESKLGTLIGNEDFMETVAWDENGDPLFSGEDDGLLKIVLPEGVEKADYTGMMEAAIPDVYKRRVTLFRAQGFTGMDLYYQLVAANRGTMDQPGKGVSRAAHLQIIKTKTRQNNRSRRKDRVRNLRRAA